MMRYLRLWPPPWWRVVMRPLLLRPPFFESGASRVFSGSSLVMSLKSDTDMNRRPADVGLYRLTATGYTPGPNASMVWPSATVTTAFFQPLRVPAVIPRRFGFAG